MPQNTNGNTNTSSHQYQDGSALSSESASHQWSYNRISTTNQSQLPSTVDMNAIKAGPSDSTFKDVNSSSSSDSNVS